MSFFPIIVLSNKIYNDIFTITKPIYLKDSNTLLYNDEEISFDYLIFEDTSLITNLNNTQIMLENNIPITNFFNQTSIENIFFTSNISLTINDIINNEIY